MSNIKNMFHISSICNMTKVQFPEQWLSSHCKESKAEDALILCWQFTGCMEAHVNHWNIRVVSLVWLLFDQFSQRWRTWKTPMIYCKWRIECEKHAHSGVTHCKYLSVLGNSAGSMNRSTHPRHCPADGVTFLLQRVTCMCHRSIHRGSGVFYTHCRAFISSLFGPVCVCVCVRDSVHMCVCVSVMGVIQVLCPGWLSSQRG